MIDLSPGGPGRRLLVDILSREDRLLPHAASILKCQRARIVFRGAEDPGVVVGIRHACESPVCSACGWKRIRRFLRRYIPVFGSIVRELNDPHALKFVTLPWGPVQDPGSGDIAVLDKAVAFLRKFFDGGLAVMEYSEGLHLHVHALVVGRYLDQGRLSEEWKKRTGRLIVDIREIPIGDLNRTLRYVLKYLGKALPFRSSEVAAQFVRAHYRRRKVRSFGTVWGRHLLPANTTASDPPGAPLVFEASVLPDEVAEEISTLYAEAGVPPPAGLLPRSLSS